MRLGTFVIISWIPGLSSGILKKVVLFEKGAVSPSDLPKNSPEIVSIYKLQSKLLIFYRGGGYDRVRRAPYQNRRIGKPVGRLRRKARGPGTGSQLHFTLTASGKAHDNESLSLEPALAPPSGEQASDSETERVTERCTSLMAGAALFLLWLVQRFLGVSIKEDFYETKTSNKFAGCGLYGGCNAASVCVCGGKR